MSMPVEAILWNDWHAVAEWDRLRRVGRFRTRLLGVPLELGIDAGTGRPIARCMDDSGTDRRGAAVPAVDRHGLVWACLGQPARDIVDFPECHDTDRLVATAGSVQVAVSGLRAVENFLDLSHLAFVHAGYLGEQPHTEVKHYTVESSAEHGILATGCRVYQPKASPVATDGFDVDYTYAVLRPYIVALYKANPVERQRRDMIALVVQPVTEESCIAHMLFAYLKHDVVPAQLRQFMQLIFGQDRPILENQLPKRLPLNPRAEIHVRADSACAAYRRWLDAAGVRFGALAD